MHFSTVTHRLASESVTGDRVELRWITARRCLCLPSNLKAVTENMPQDGTLYNSSRLMRYVHEQVGGPDDIKLQTNGREMQFKRLKVLRQRQASKATRSSGAHLLASPAKEQVVTYVTLHAPAVKRYLCNQQRFIERVAYERGKLACSIFVVS